MAGFEDLQKQATMIAKELEWKLDLLGVDWRNETELRALAREALQHRAKEGHPAFDPDHPGYHTRLEVFGLIGLMLKAMEEGAMEGVQVHGSDVWKALARAIWAEKGGGSGGA